jgi:hypothetical protein
MQKQWMRCMVCSKKSEKKDNRGVASYHQDAHYKCTGPNTYIKATRDQQKAHLCASFQNLLDAKYRKIGGRHIPTFH